MEQNYIGISEDRLHRILGVARKAYKIAKDMGYNENFCRKMFMVGWIHDVGYEFAKQQDEHPHISSEMLYQLFSYNCKDIYSADISVKTNQAIYYHSKYPAEHIEMNIEWKILTMADMTVDSKGNEVTVSQRLDDIKNRYGEHSNQYLTACDICYRIGLTAVNFAANIT